MNASRSAIHTLFCLGLASAVWLGAAPVASAQVIQILRGAGQQTTYGSAFPEPLTVWVVDSATRRSMPGVPVEFTPGRGISLSPSTAVTDEKGLASVTATGLEVCVTSASVQIAGHPATRVEFANLQVAKAPLTVLPDDIVSSAGSEIPAVANYSFVGFVNGDTVATANITGNPALTTTATNPSMHANYLIKGNPGTLSSPNYTFVPGYGTLALVGGESAEDLTGEQAAVSPLATSEEPGASVRPALDNQRDAGSLELPAFIAGLRGESGVFVRAAIWAQPAASANTPSANTRTAMLINVAASPQTLSAPVRAVPMPTQAAANSASATLPTQAAVKASFTSPEPASPATPAPVRAVMLPGQSSPTATSSAFSGTPIRKAFIPPSFK